MGSKKSTKSVTIRKYEVRILFLVFFLSIVYCLLPTSVYSQYTKYWVQFTDKNNSLYSTSNPSAFLSARSIQRRSNQGIAVVQNDLPVNQSYIDSVKKVPNVTFLNRSKWFNAITIACSDTNSLNIIKSFSFVQQTKPVKRLCGSSQFEECNSSDVDRDLKYPFHSGIQSGAKSSEQMTFDSTYYGKSYVQVNMLNGVCMHNLGFQGQGMVIAVLDVGFDRVDSAAAFDTVITNNQILGRRNFVDINNNVTPPGEHHGTWCLSLIAGNIPGELIGTAPKAKFWLLRTEDGPTENVIEEDNWVSGAEFADSVGADILSTSLGYTDFDSVKIDSVTKIPNPANHTRADMDGNTTRISIGTDIAASKGMLPVCAAGNMGLNPWHFIGAPADADSALAVGAVDSIKQYVGYSSKGPSVDGRIKPNVAAQGHRPYITDLADSIFNTYGGTSFACPLIAGMAACLWQAHPSVTCMQLYHAIEQTASLASNPDSLMGYGIPDFCAANNILSVQENSALAGDVLSVYPNPFSESTTLQVQGLNAWGLELSVYDILGNLVHSQILVAQSTTIRLDLARGVYTLKVKEGGRSYSAKLVKY